MSTDVFLSYARSTSAEHARAVRDALAARGVAVFLDESDIDVGERFPEQIVDALLGARVVVLFTDDAYFTRWYCLWEWRVARTPFLAACERPGASEREKEAALQGLVLALPPAGRPTALDRFPPLLRETNWPAADRADRVAETVLTALATGTVPLADRLDALPETGGAAAVRAKMLDVARLPAPRTLKGVPRVPLALPQSLGEHFVGRADDLWRIDDLLVTRAGGTPCAAAVTAALTAMGGTGKTRLALEYLHRFGPERFPGGLFWLDAEQPTVLEAQQHAVLEELDPATPPLTVYRDPASGRRLARDLVRALEALPAERPALVVLDNVPEPDAEPGGAGATPLETLWPGLGLTAALVTSRFDVAFASGGAVAPLTLGALARADAVALLTDGLQTAGPGALPVAAWDQVAEWLGDLPLLLTLLNKAVQQGGYAAQDLLAAARAGADVSAAGDAAFGALAGQVITGQRAAAPRGWSAAMRISYACLSPAAQRAARVLATLAPVAVPTAVLDAAPETFPPAARVELRTHSVVTTLPAADPPLYGLMHRGLADFLRAQAAAESSATEDSAAAAGAVSAVMTPTACRDPASWPLMRACAPHAERLVTAGAEDALTDAAMVVGLALGLGATLSAQGEAARARTMNETALRVAATRLGPEHPDTLVSAQNVASTLEAQGDLAAARALQERVLEAYTRLLGPEHPDTLTSADNLATTLQAQGDLAGARARQERVLEARTRLLGPEHPDTLTSADNLATTLQAQGDLAGARARQEQVLKALAHVLGPEHPDTLTSAHNLAATLHDQGDLAGARALNAGVLEARTRLLGPEHPDTLTSADNLASTLQDQGDLAGARARQEQVLEARTRVLGPEHPTTLTSAYNLAVTLYLQGDVAGARRRLETVYYGRARALGAAHQDTRTSRADLELVLRALGDAAAADALLTA